MQTTTTVNKGISYTLLKAEGEVANFVESFWCLYNLTDEDREIVILPDGRIDLIFSRTDKRFHPATLLGLETSPGYGILKANIQMFAISFKPLAFNYILREDVAQLLNGAKEMPHDFWGFGLDELACFEIFCQTALAAIIDRLPIAIDPRKQQLFELIFASNGSTTIKELSEKVFWNSRQMNRYFSHQFGLSLKAYCNILRFRASFQHIKAGKLFPEANFFDQSHFIREVKKFSGVLPKELSRNQNDRFIQFSTL